jgi:Zn-dependent M28 family amino/carboxypeptidase
MPRKRTKIAAATAVAASAALAVTLVPAAGAAPQGDEGLPDRLADAINPGKMNRHLVALQRIAQQNDGNRASGTTGYDQSADYVAGRLESAGYHVTRQEFDFTYFDVLAESLTAADADHEVHMMRYSTSTPEGGVTAPTAAVDSLGCEASDFDDVDVEDKIALISRGECAFADKQANAGAAGAVAALVYNTEDEPLHGTLGDPDAGVVPTGGISLSDGEELVGNAGEEVTLELVAEQEERQTENVIAETKTGVRDNVVMAGAHLDSVPEGPGINDNGTGSAAMLTTALELGASPDVNNAVRFAWWGAEEFGLVGSTHYVNELSFDEQLDIAMYLNFDMIGSPNAGYFVYDGDGEEFGLPGPEGSAQIEQAFVERLESQDVPTEPTEISFRSDYAAFFEAGIPFGGLFTGAEGIKTEEQADKWGGEAGVAYDPCYHDACDTLGNVDREALGHNGEAAAYVIGTYALSTEDVNGVAPGERKQRERQAAQRSQQGMAPQSAEDHHRAAA